MKVTRLFCGLVGLALIAQPAFAKRVALVIGNSNYGKGLELKNPVNDARAIAASLRGLQFTVIERVDQDLKGMDDALVEFHRTLKEGDVGWFFYAGHGLQAQNANYLLPIGADVRESFELKSKAVNLESIKSAMLESGSRLNVIVLDCCRDNPLTRRWTRSAGKGLAAVQEVPDGMIVAFSTAANTTALDGEGANSPYTAHLVNALNSRPADGLEVKQLFFTVGQGVKKAIEQRPYLELDATMDNYFLDRAAPAGEPAPEAVVQMPPTITPLTNQVATQVAMTMPPPAAQTTAPVWNGQTPAQGAFMTPPGVTNTLSGVFANGPYAAYNSYTQGQILRKVQERLQGAGLYKSRIDGGMGAGTQIAINTWQQTNGLPVTGLLDQATLQQMMLLGLTEQTAPARAASYSGKSRARSRSDDDDGGSSSSRGSWWDRHGGQVLGGMGVRPRW